jgi:hypothetical protein
LVSLSFFSSSPFGIFKKITIFSSHPLGVIPSKSKRSVIGASLFFYFLPDAFRLSQIHLTPVMREEKLEGRFRLLSPVAIPG